MKTRQVILALLAIAPLAAEAAPRAKRRTRRPHVAAKSVTQARPALSREIERSARGPSGDELRNRSRRLIEDGYFFAGLRDRLALVGMRAAQTSDLQAIGELALALNRLDPIASAAAELEHAGESASQWPPGFRAAMAAYEFRQGRVARASAYLPSPGAAEGFSIPAARARAIFVAAGVRAAQERPGEAADMLLPLTQPGVSPDPVLARLQRARLFYELGRYSESLEELSRVQKSSPHWYDGLTVGAWSAYKLRDDNLTLGQAMSLNSPHLAGKFNPESSLLEAASLYRLCHYESAQRSLVRLREKYGKFPGVVAAFRREYGERFAGVAALLKHARGQGSSTGGFSEKDWELLVDGVYGSESVSDADRMLLQVQQETENLNSLVPNAERDRWILTLRQSYKNELEGAKREAYTVALRAIKRRLSEMEQDVARNLEGALAIEVEINTRLRERLMTGETPKMREVDFDAEVRKGYEFWPFEGEFWRDEVGGYAFATTDVCPAGSRSEVEL